MTNAIKQFEVGQTYSCRSLCDYNCIWSWTVAARTAQTVTMTTGEKFRFNAKLTEYNSAETIFPKGRYSMAPVLTAHKVAA